MHFRNTSPAYRANSFMGARNDRRRQQGSVSKHPGVGPRAYTRNDIAEFYWHLKEEVKVGEIIVAGRAAEVIRGFLDTTHIVQFVHTCLYEQGLKWLATNAVSMHWKGDPRKVCHFTPKGALYHANALNLESYRVALKAPEKEGVRYLSFLANLDFFKTFQFKHKDTEDHFEMVETFLKEFKADESDLELLITMRRYVETPESQRSPEQKDYILSQIKSRPKAESWLAAFEAELA